MNNKQKLELTWIGKDEEVKAEPRILLYDKENSYGDQNTDNMLIHGDNLLALKALEQNYTGKIKCIYIDPPYNTGSAFEHYDDNLEHSIWLSLMKARLEILKKLLSEDGVILIQIDDNEQAYLKVLCDEIFGRNNYLNTVTVKMKNIAGASGGGEDKRLKKNIEFILCYTKNYNNFTWVKNAYNLTEIYELVNQYKENNISWKYTSVLYKEGEKEFLTTTVDGDENDIKIYLRKNPEFKSVSQIAKQEGMSEKEVYYKYINRIFTTAMPQSSIRIRVLDKLTSLNFVNDFISIEYTPKSGKNKGRLYEQFYKGDKLRLLTWLNDVVEIKDEVIYKKDMQGTYWDGINLNNLNKEGNVDFANGKKPEALIERLLDITTNKGDLVLDSFLGSGTTGAVAHKMGRKWIGIELGEHCYTHCKPRLEKVVDGEQGGISKSVDWQGGGGFKFYELAPSLLKKDRFGNWIIDETVYNADLLAAAVAKLNGYKFCPSESDFWKQGTCSENAYIFTTTEYVSADYLDTLSKEMDFSDRLLICCPAFDLGLDNRYDNIEIKKIPKSVLNKCEYGKDNYNLNIIDTTEIEEDCEEWDND